MCSLKDELHGLVWSSPCCLKAKIQAHFLADDVQRKSFPTLCRKMKRGHHAGAVGSNFQRFRGMVGKVMQAAEEVPLLDLRSQFHRGLPYSVLRTGDVVFQIDRLYKTGRCWPSRIDLHDFPGQQAIMPQDVL